MRRLLFFSALVIVISACRTETETVQVPPPDPAAGDDGTLPADDDGGTATHKDASTSKPLCHTGGYDCKDGKPCCGGFTCESGSCKSPKGGQCRGMGSDCSATDCCAGYECHDFTFGSRCVLPKTCSKAGAACLDTGNCCGGLTCQSGKCAPPPRENSCKVYGERCGAKDCCPSTPYCENETCCMPGDWNNTTCGSDSDCCTGVCVGGLCELSNLGGACTFMEDCGKDPYARCEDHACCIDKSGSCASPSDCCSGSCVGGKCACLPKGAKSPSSGNCCSLVLVSGICQ